MERTLSLILSLDLISLDYRNNNQVSGQIRFWEASVILTQAALPHFRVATPHNNRLRRTLTGCARAYRRVPRLANQLSWHIIIAGVCFG